MIKDMSELSESALTSFSKFRVTSADTDMFARLRPGAAVNYLIQAAIDSADKLGLGYGGIRHQNLFWVLSRLTFELHRPVKWYEPVEVETWPKTVERILYLRDFILRDSNRKVVAKATSGWLAVDLETRRMKKIEGIHASFFDHLKDKYAIPDLPEKLFPVEGGDEHEVSPSYFDFDLNGHVTTTRYVDWMMDTLTNDFHKDNYPRKLSLNLMKETMPEETIFLMKKPDAGRIFRFEGVNSNSAVTVFRATVEF